MLGRPPFDAAAARGPRAGAAARPWRLRLLEGLARAARVAGLWASRGRERRALADLADADGRLLRDIGVSRGDALRESAKPFWRP